MDDLSAIDLENLIDECEQPSPWRYLFWFIWMWF